MKAFVIKNKEGKMLCWHHIAGYYFDHFNIKSLFYMEFGTEKEIKAVFKNKEFDNTDCTIVPITICEGDLEEENRKIILKELESIKEMIEYKQSAFGLMSGFANKNSRIYKDLCAKCDACSEILKPIYEKISIIQQAKESVNA